ncbi:hypothetical protein OGAPHI_000249 [Ogataea philodendri]|uniref:S-adenosyl-L-methionine-dependent tRNA 4-demethylwyosine synthase n=2 Tax=Ogataea TaxID=461281 RepID=A0A9P8PGL0_9ASCO|nr:uncharacterized protein OGAPHI_000249 [Ogataea philodendri]KAH3671546.1 hypothetical protein OGAPHI_000249 [Ogataea philodendri]
MDSWLAPAVVVAIIYLLCGGRWTFVLLASVAYLLSSKRHIEEPETKDVAESRPSKTHACKCGGGGCCQSKKQPSAEEPPSEYEIDFTYSFKDTEPAVDLKRAPKIIRANKSESKPVSSPFLIFYSSLTGSSKRAAEKVCDALLAASKQARLLNLDDDVDDLDSFFLNVPTGPPPNYILVLPSYDTDSPIDYFLEFLQDTATDFRVDKFPLRKVAGFSVLGIGDSESWASHFCTQAVAADKWLSKLGARRTFPLGKLCIKRDFETKLQTWIDGLIDSIDHPILDESNSDSSDDETLVDVEDLLPKTDTKKMVADGSPTYKSLTKQGYSVIGSHSGVKICRWTKSALRGRGSCYKFAFYGIKSHLCMETTPSLSCSNKCVFCWRHGTNPVGTTWRWEVDEPEVIVEGALQAHYKKIKQMRGVPGVSADRFAEAFQVRHCALSLVGEPIFYPHINRFLNLLHEKLISSFLVCNAQHPDQLATLKKVTQLYVSIDAPTKEELKVVDRPLYRDYWERLERCLEILRTVQSHQRTVYRLTLVKGFNMSDATAYADLVAKGEPCLIEVKGATFCGSSAGNGNPLTMQNIPFYEECQNFVRKLTAELKSRGLDYDLAAEHAHSCCILIAHRKFFINGQWHTHIDYPKFFKLLESGQSFNALDYTAPTPEWAYWGSSEAGFNPEDTKFNRKQEKEKRQQNM